MLLAYREGRTTAPGALRAADAEPPPTASTGAAPLSSRDTSSATSAGPNVMFLLQAVGRAGGRQGRVMTGEQVSRQAGRLASCLACKQRHCSTLTPAAQQQHRLLNKSTGWFRTHAHLKGTAVSSRRPVPGSSRNSKPFWRNTFKLSLQGRGGTKVRLGGGIWANVPRRCCCFNSN